MIITCLLNNVPNVLRLQNFHELVFFSFSERLSSASRGKQLVFYFCTRVQIMIITNYASVFISPDDAPPDDDVTSFAFHLKASKQPTRMQPVFGQLPRNTNRKRTRLILFSAFISFILHFMPWRTSSAFLGKYKQFAKTANRRNFRFRREIRRRKCKLQNHTAFIPWRVTNYHKGTKSVNAGHATSLVPLLAFVETGGPWTYFILSVCKLMKVYG